MFLYIQTLENNGCCCTIYPKNSKIKQNIPKIPLKTSIRNKGNSFFVSFTYIYIYIYYKIMIVVVVVVVVVVVEKISE